MREHVDVAIIGAGPYGLSLAAHLRAAGVEFRIFGRPMDSWRRFMPPGMLLKSHPWASNLADPRSRYTLRDYCAERRVAYHDSLMPLPLETFIAYGDNFQALFVPHVEQKLVTTLSRFNSGFRAVLDDGEIVTARRVIIAVGVHPFKHVPEVLSGLPAEALSHSGDYGPLDALAGKDVVVVGSGASATDLAALLQEKGAAVTLVARDSALKFAPIPRARGLLGRRFGRPMKRFLHPNSGIGSGWLLKICADTPALIHALPEPLRLHLAKSILGPQGQSEMRERVVGRVQTLLGRRVESAYARRGKAELRLLTGDGATENMRVDHVIAATGFRIDLSRLGFLDRELLSMVKAAEGSPVLSRDYETSVAGLHLIGPAATASFGPVNRFVFGAGHPSRRLAEYLSVATTADRYPFERLRFQLPR